MKQSAAEFSPRNALGVISLFVGVVELAFAYPVTVLSGVTQIVFVIFMVSFPVLVLAGFFFVLLKYPENFYSPSDFQDPQAFTRLVERRDKKLDEHLKKRTQEISELNQILKNSLGKNKQAIEDIAKKIKDLPELDRGTLEMEFNQIKSLLKDAEKFLSNYTSRNLESYFQHSLSGVRRVWFDTDTLGKTWSLDFLIDVAVAVLKDIRKNGIEDKGGTGSVVIWDCDYDLTFSYNLNVSEEKYGGDLTIKLTHSECLAG